jgi:hypothetical protein
VQDSVLDVLSQLAQVREGAREQIADVNEVSVMGHVLWCMIIYMHYNNIFDLEVNMRSMFSYITILVDVVYEDCITQSMNILYYYHIIPHHHTTHHTTSHRRSAR